MSFLAAMIKWLIDRIELVEFDRVDHNDGGYYICEKGDGHTPLDPSHAPSFKEHTVSRVYMTRHQFENLPEFSGF